MDKIIDQLGLNSTYFVQLGIFIFVFLVLSRSYFKPFLKLFDLRHKRTVEDAEAAQKMMADAETKLSDYQNKLVQARSDAKREFDEIVSKARKEEEKILAEARNEAKKITQEATAQVEQQREKLKQELKSEVDALAKTVSEQLLTGKA